jgi:aspartyl protease family protein
MALTSGTRSLIGEAAKWSIAAGLVIGGLTYFHELGSLTGLALGVPTTGDAPVQAATHARESQEGKTRGLVEIRAGAGGHYHTSAEINGRPVDVMVDTGATMVALTYEDAERAGLLLKPADFTRAVSTANGVARIAPVILDRVSIGDIMVRNVAASVSERGRLHTTLLGMSFLSRLERVDMSSGILVLKD